MSSVKCQYPIRGWFALLFRGWPLRLLRPPIPGSRQPPSSPTAPPRRSGAGWLPVPHSIAPSGHRSPCSAASTARPSYICRGRINILVSSSYAHPCGIVVPRAPTPTLVAPSHAASDDGGWQLVKSSHVHHSPQPAPAPPTRHPFPTELDGKCLNCFFE